MYRYTYHVIIYLYTIIDLYTYHVIIDLYTYHVIIDLYTYNVIIDLYTYHVKTEIYVVRENLHIHRIENKRFIASESTVPESWLRLLGLFAAVTRFLPRVFPASSRFFAASSPPLHRLFTVRIVTHPRCRAKPTCFHSDVLP